MRLPPHLDTLNTHASYLQIEGAVHLRERKQLVLYMGSYTVLDWSIYRGIFARFSPQWGFSMINFCVLFVLLCFSFFQWSLCFGLITPKILTWYQSQPRIRHCVATYIAVQKFRAHYSIQIPPKISRKQRTI